MENGGEEHFVKGELTAYLITKHLANPSSKHNPKSLMSSRMPKQ